MDPNKGGKSSSSSLPLWSRASTRLGIRRKSSSRPAISAPFGPVKNSRGPDFSRSDTLVIVNGIEDCAYSNLPPPEVQSSLVGATKSRSSLATATRRLSASYPQPPSAASPTVANSRVTAATGIQATLDKEPVYELRKASSTVPPRPVMHSGLKTSSTVSLLPSVSQPFHHDENIPLGSDGVRLGKSSGQQVGGRLPASKTINVLQDLKDIEYRPHTKSTSSLTSNNSKQIATPVITTPVAPLAKLRTAQTSQTSFLSHSVDSIYQDFDPQLVSEAQPSAYWSGRFMSLHDKYSSEALTHQKPPYRVVSTPDRQTSYPPLPSSTRRNITSVPRATYLPHATTTSALLELPQAAKPRLKPPPPQQLKATKDEDAQGRRIFGRLEALCTTDEARASLFRWQQSYARRTNRPSLLPDGGTMNGKSFVSKWFNNHGSKSGRRNLTMWREEGSGGHIGQQPPSRPVEMHHFRATLT